MIGLYNTASLANDGNIFIALVVLPSGSSEVLKILEAYKPKEQTILTSTHRKYQCATETRDNPVDGIAKVPPTWIDIGPTNKWALFDEKTTETTKSAGNYTIQLKPTTNTDMIAMMSR